MPATIGMAILGLALLIFTLVLIVWLKKRHEDPDQSGTHTLRNAVRIVNPLKGGSLKKKTVKHHSSSSESDEDVDDLVQKKLNNFVPSNQPWYKSRMYETRSSRGQLIQRGPRVGIPRDIIT